MGTLVLLRHGESVWNAENLFTGWVDVPLSAKGESEARRGGELLADAGLLPDLVHTSVLRPAIATRKPTVVLRLAGLALDVDRPDDLHALACASGAKESQRLVRSWGFGSRAAAIARAAGF